MWNESISNLAFGIVVFVFAIILHELGHVIGYVILGRPFPQIRITKFCNFIVGKEKDIAEITMRQLCFIDYMGILTGLVYLVFMGVENTFYLIYLFLSLSDISTILDFFHYPHIFRDVKLKYIELHSYDSKNNRKLIMNVVNKQVDIIVGGDVKDV
jgi:hypothetical protein